MFLFGGNYELLQASGPSVFACYSDVFRNTAYDKDPVDTGLIDDMVDMLCRLFGNNNAIHIRKCDVYDEKYEELLMYTLT